MKIIAASEEFRNSKTIHCIALSRKDNFTKVLTTAPQQRATILSESRGGFQQLRYLVKLPGQKKQQALTGLELWRVFKEFSNNSR